MSWSDRRAFLVGASVSIVGLGGCGFEPVYGGRSASEPGSVTANLVNTRIARIPDRLGQQLRNALIDRMHVYGNPTTSAHTVAVSVRESLRKLAIQKDDSTTRFQLILDSSFVLTDPQGVSVLQERARSVNSFNALNSEYATLIAQDDARIRGIRQLSEEIVTRLSLYYARTGS